MLLKYLYIVLAFLFLALGGLGIILPGLPTTPFVLLAAGLFIRSSEKLYNRLLNNRVFGPYIKRYMMQKGMTRAEKITAISMIWIMISISMLAVDNRTMRIVLPLLACIGTVIVSFGIKTVLPIENDEVPPEQENSEL